VRQDGASWYLEVALPARRDQVDDADDVVERINVAFQTETEAVSALAVALAAVIAPTP